MTLDPHSVQGRITSFWSSIGADYESHPGNVPEIGSPLFGAWVDAVRRVLPAAPSDVLDVGTGTGFLSLIAAELGHRVTGIDLAEGMLAVARGAVERRHLEATLRIGDAVAPDFPAASFDAIMSRHLLWTLRLPEAALANWRRLLRPGGLVIVIDGFWFVPSESESDAADADAAPNLFDRHYDTETRAALPFMELQALDPVAGIFAKAGFEAIDAAWHPELKDPAADSAPYILRARTPQ